MTPHQYPDPALEFFLVEKSSYSVYMQKCSQCTGFRFVTKTDGIWRTHYFPGMVLSETCEDQAVFDVMDS